MIRLTQRLNRDARGVIRLGSSVTEGGRSVRRGGSGVRNDG